MMWILLALLALGMIAVAVRVMRRAAPDGGWDDAGPAPRRRCLRCRGTGWVGGEPERTLNFTGEGFENRHTPKTPCPDCGATGFAGL